MAHGQALHPELCDLLSTGGRLSSTWLSLSALVDSAPAISVSQRDALGLWQYLALHSHLSTKKKLLQFYCVSGHLVCLADPGCLALLTAVIVCHHSILR